jgi:serine/threonine protein kinase
MEFLEYHDDARTSGSKFVMDCNETPITKVWLDSMTVLKSLKNKKVVIKVADVKEDLSHEWDIFVKLKKYRIPGILENYCYFRCNDDIKRFIEGEDAYPSLCNGRGNSMQVLIMKYIPDKSMKEFDWRTVPVDTFRSCVKQIILSLYEGYKKCYFRHGDLHIDNVLMKKTTIKEVYYKIANITVPIVSYKIQLMDFELSRIEDASVLPEKIFLDVMTLIQKMNTLSFNYFNTNNLETIYNAAKKAKETQAPIDTLLSFLPMCDQLEYKKVMGGKLICGGKRRKVWLCKHY